MTQQRQASVKECALWALQRLVPEHGVSNESLAFAVPGGIDVTRMAEHLGLLIDRHPALRTRFPQRDSLPIAELVPPSGEVFPISQHAPGARTVAEVLTEFASAPFDLETGPLLRVGVWAFPGEDVCCLTFHHLAYDFVTASIIVTSLLEGYAAGGDVPMPPPPVPETAWYAEPELEPESLDYWRTVVDGVDPAGQRLAMARLDPVTPTFSGAVETLDLSAATMAGVLALAGQFGVTPVSVMLATYQVLLARHGAGPDLVVGALVDGREPGMEEAVGYHSSTLPIRGTVTADLAFGDLLAATADALWDGLDHRDVSFEAVIPAFAESQAHWRTPLFRYTFNARPFVDGSSVFADGTRVQMIPVETRYNRHDLDLVVHVGREQGRLVLGYSTEILHADDARALIQRYRTLLDSLAAGGSHEPIGQLPIWSPADVACIEAANSTADDGNTPVVPEAVRTVARSTPDAVALVDGSEVWTYSELVHVADTIRERLLSEGIGPGDVVALYARRGLGLAAATLAAWECGAAYLPLHLHNPADLLSFQLEDSGASLVLSDRPLPEGTAVHGRLLPIDSEGPTEVPAVPPPVVSRGDDLAYLIYTSGSTGRPKGVEIVHGGLANLLCALQDVLKVRPTDSMLWLTTFSFDMSAAEVFLPLVTGARIIVAAEDSAVDADHLFGLIVDHDVSIIQATPTTWAPLLRLAGNALHGRRVLCGGEPMSPTLAHALRGSGATVFNVYGPTETTIWSTSAALVEDPDDLVPIGQPLRNTTALVVNDLGVALPPGIDGELCLAGRGVARGYRNRPELTAERFAPLGTEGEIFYRTGDRARWRHDGMLEMLGRTDRQVKIHSQRLELGEIESALMTHPAVQVAGVVLRPDLPVEEGLVAFVDLAVAWQHPVDIDPSEVLWRYLRGKLPAYALPSRILCGPLPVNSSGKVDHRALTRQPLPSQGPSGGEADDPAVAKLVELWRDLLDDPGIGPKDNFFLSGGSSLLAIAMLQQLRDRTGTDVPLNRLLEDPTPIEFARNLHTTKDR